ncbi:uncharacterized protein LOC132717340 [Ruditapes philippinarum]|uniref:uncharacterized protein LOC132717340 n=1 Tax=Ruditapes philippinarum TaxID=129788 RepID=UPI00295BB131|nr:uncharacterized protein LOC132717340 [Ruditapes philippinarum]
MTSVVFTSDVISICSMSVTSVGASFVGVQPSDFSTTFKKNATTMSQQPYDKLYARIDFGLIENGGSENEIVIQFEAIVVNSSQFIDASTYDVTANVTIDSYTATAVVSFTGVVQDLWSITPPLANISSPGPVVIGDIANWTVTLDLQDAVNKVEVQAWVNGTYEYPACNMVMGNIGPAYACIDETVGDTTKSNGSIFFEIPTLINTEFNENVTVANGTLLEVIVTARVPSHVSPIDDLFLNIEIYLDDKLVFLLSEIMDTWISSLPAPAGTPSILINAMNSVTTLVPGSALVFIVDVVTPPDSVTFYNMTITTDPNMATICDVQMMKIGDNLCMDDFVASSYTSTTSNAYFDQVNVEIGSVPNLNRSAEVSSEENNVQFEVAVCVPDYASVNVDDVLTLTVDVYYGPSNAKVTDSLQYTIASTLNPSLATGNISFSNSSTVFGFIGQRVDVNVTAVFEQTTDSFTINITSPVLNNNTLVYLESALISRVGEMLYCLENRTLTLLSNETVSFSQINSLVYEVGPVTHTGMTERNPFVNDNSTGENEITFTISVLVADNVANVQGSIIPINLKLEGVSGNVAYGTANIEVQITGVETPILISQFTMVDYMNKTSGDNVTCHVTLYLDENSTAHAQDVQVHVYTPYYIGFGNLFDVEDAVVTHISNLPDPGMKFSIGEIDFQDFVTFSFTLVLDPARQMPMGLDYVETVIPADVTSRGAIRGDRADTGIVPSQLFVSEFGFSTETPGSIGMENGIIQDCQISASSYLDTNRPEEARLNVGSGWKPYVRGSPFCDKEYLQINVGTPAYITGLQVQSTTDNYQDIITSFSLQYSDDRITWYDVTEDDGVSQKVFVVSVTSGGSVSDIYDFELTENERFNAQYIKLLSWSCLVGIRLELKGLKQTGSAVDCSTLADGVPLVAEQSYIMDVATGNMFVCGLEAVDGNVVCSASDDKGITWRGIIST